MAASSSFSSSFSHAAPAAPVNYRFWLSSDLDQNVRIKMYVCTHTLAQHNASNSCNAHTAISWMASAKSKRASRRWNSGTRECTTSMRHSGRERGAQRLTRCDGRESTQMFVESQVWGGGRPLSTSHRTAFHTTATGSSGDQARWGQWLDLAVKYRDVPRDAAVLLRLYDVPPGPATPPALVGCSAVAVFSAAGRLHRGRLALRLHLGLPGDGRLPAATPGLSPLDLHDEISRLNKVTLSLPLPLSPSPSLSPSRIDTLCSQLLKKYESNAIAHVDWLDRLAFIKLEHVKQSIQRSRVGELFLHVEVPSFEHPVIFHEATPLEWERRVATMSSKASAISAAAPKESSGRYDELLSTDYSSGGHKLVAFDDHEMNRDNPVELKHIKLARSQRRGLYDRDLKPNKEERARITVCVPTPSAPGTSKHTLGWIANRYRITVAVHCVPSNCTMTGHHLGTSIQGTQRL
jgi:hypothetical protein